MAMTPEEYRQAAEDGARAVLKELGLDDEHAGKDMRELRDLLDVWRDARKTAITTFVRVITMTTLTALAIGLWAKFGGNGGGNP